MSKAVYALESYSVRKLADGWYYLKTYGRSRSDKWKGPYRNEKSVTLVIARELRKDLIRRHSRTLSPVHQNPAA